MPSPCPMCQAPDCHLLKANELDTCPIYFGVRDALLPTGGDVPSEAALALFWLARCLGEEEKLLTRQARLADLVSLFTFARLEALRFVEPDATRKLLLREPS